jgi:hypothetical protein
MEALKLSFVRLNRRVEDLEKEFKALKSVSVEPKVIKKEQKDDVFIEPVKETLKPGVMPKGRIQGDICAHGFVPPEDSFAKENKVDPHQSQIEELIKELQSKADEVLLTAQELKELDDDCDLESIASIATDAAIEQLQVIDEGLNDENPDVVKIYHDCGSCAKKKLKLHKKLQKEKKLDEKDKKKKLKQSKLKVIEEEQAALTMQLHRLKLV